MSLVISQMLTAKFNFFATLLITRICFKVVAVALGVVMGSISTLGLAAMPWLLQRGSEVVAQSASLEALQILDWVGRSQDNQGLPFVIVDKKEAKVWVFNANGALLGVAPALMGSAHGDHSVPGIGERELSTLLPEERTTPAGRFVAELGVNFYGEDIVWVDYDAAVSLHRVRANNAKERRLERLASATPADNRISYGCINVPHTFYDKIVKPAFSAGTGIVYVLPEVRALNEVFGTAPITAY